METNNRIEQYQVDKQVDKLFAKYGALLTVAQMAELFDRSEVGCRQFLRGNSAIAQKLRPARRKFGRRVYYMTCDVALILASGGQ